MSYWPPRTRLFGGWEEEEEEEEGADCRYEGRSSEGGLRDTRPLPDGGFPPGGVCTVYSFTAAETKDYLGNVSDVKFCEVSICQWSY